MSRKKTEEYILKSFKISKNTHNILVDFFKGMTDKEFHQFMLDVQNKVKNLSFVIPHEEQHKESDILDWCESIGVKPFQKLTYVYEDGFEHTIDIKTFIIDAIVKRAAQTQDKKVSIPTGNKINSLTGQVTGDSLSAQFTLPETLITIGFGAKKAPNELINARGGDLGLLNAMYKELFTNGRVSMEEIKPYSTKNVTTKTLKVYLLASHIKSTL